MIIAATAMAHRLVLVTENRKDFPMVQLAGSSGLPQSGSFVIEALPFASTIGAVGSLKNDAGVAIATGTAFTVKKFEQWNRVFAAHLGPLLKFGDGEA